MGNRQTTSFRTRVDPTEVVNKRHRLGDRINANSKRRHDPKSKSRLVQGGDDTNNNERMNLAVRQFSNIHVLQNYEIIKVIGQGHLGEILLVRRKQKNQEVIDEKLKQLNIGKHAIQNERLYACKTVHAARMKSMELKEVLNEIEIMRELDHPNILQLFEVYHTKHKLWMIMELCKGGDLATHKLKLNASGRFMTEVDIAIILEQILRAVAYMHTKHVCHRDIKLENIMFQSKDPGSLVKLIDFGLSNRFAATSKMREACGTAYTAAPEVVIGSSYNEKSDIWSIGVIAYLLLSDDFPFVEDMKDYNDINKLNRFMKATYVFGPAWKERHISQIAKDFISSCLKRHPIMRWDARAALSFVQKEWLPSQVKSYPGVSPSISRSLGRRRIRMNTTTLNHLMKGFLVMSNLKKTILITMASVMDKSSLDDLQDLFLRFDTEGKGTISLLELRDVLREMHPDKRIDDEVISQIFKGIDRDSSGQIYYKEFLAALSESQGLLTMERLAEAFNRLDVDGNGMISQEDLEKILGNKCEKSVVRAMIDEADYKNNGQIDYEEFLRLMSIDPNSLGLDPSQVTRGISSVFSENSS